MSGTTIIAQIYMSLSASLGKRASKVSEKLRLDLDIGLQNMFYTKCSNVIIDSIGPSIILRSICFILVIEYTREWRLRTRCR